MSEYQPLTTIADYDALDTDECVAGYRAGLAGETQEPGSDKSKSYWHGWRNAMIDRGFAPPDAASAAFVAVCMARQRAN